MDAREIDALTDALAPVIKRFIESKTEPLVQRIAELERALTSLRELRND